MENLGQSHEAGSRSTLCSSSKEAGIPCDPIPCMTRLSPSEVVLETTASSWIGRFIFWPSHFGPVLIQLLARTCWICRDVSVDLASDLTPTYAKQVDVILCCKVNMLICN
jgi:hypothetical protein